MSGDLSGSGKQVSVSRLPLAPMEAKAPGRRGIQQGPLAWSPEMGWREAYGSLSWMILLQLEAFPQLCVRRKVSPYGAPHARPAWCEGLRT